MQQQNELLYLEIQIQYVSVYIVNYSKWRHTMRKANTDFSDPIYKRNLFLVLILSIFQQKES